MKHTIVSPVAVSAGAMVRKPVNFNGKLIWTVGTVVQVNGLELLVDFQYNGVEFRGFWQHADVVTITN